MSCNAQAPTNGSIDKFSCGACTFFYVTTHNLIPLISNTLASLICVDYILFDSLFKSVQFKNI